MTPERFALVRSRLVMRQPDLAVLLDGVTKPHNFSAILRSCDAVGVYRAHAIEPPEGLPLARTAAQGAQKWVRVRRHPDWTAAHLDLRAAGLRLYGADVGEGARDFREVDYTLPCAVVLGTERTGLSTVARAGCDSLITIPMQGMVESLNVSVAAALILFEAQRQRLAAGLYDHSRLPEDEFQQRLFEWSHPKIARYCQERGLDYPALGETGDIVGRLPGMVDQPWSQNP